MNRFMFRNLLTAQCGIAKDALVDQSTIQAGIHMNWITTLPGSSSCHLYFAFDWLVCAYVIVFALYVITYYSTCNFGLLNCTFGKVQIVERSSQMSQLGFQGKH